MTILEANKQLNELIANKIYLEQYQNYVSSWTLNGKYILCDGFPVGLHANTIDKRMDMLCQDARRAYFIEEILKSVDIIINDIESSYDVLCSTETYIVFCKKYDDNYTFIEFSNNKYYDSGLYLKVVKLNLKSNDLIYDRIDLTELKHFHADSKISKITLNEINKKWLNKNLTQNDLYDVIAEDAKLPKCACAWRGMDKYGNYVSDIDINKLDRNICEIENTVENEKPKIYYL